MSPAHLNPAVTIAMAMIGSFSWSLVFPYIIAQMLGAMVASIILYLMFYPHYAETKNPADILGTFSTGPAIRQTSSNLISEIVGTAVLTTGILAFGQYAIFRCFTSFSGCYHHSYWFITWCNNRILFKSRT